MLVEAKVLRWGKGLQTAEGIRQNAVVIEDLHQTSAVIPADVENLFGFDNEQHPQYQYWRMNDDGLSFTEIAAELRKDFGFKPRNEEV
jgi:mannosyltransferase OCH1-like enzyme